MWSEVVPKMVSSITLLLFVWMECCPYLSVCPIFTTAENLADPNQMDTPKENKSTRVDFNEMAIPLDYIRHLRPQHKGRPDNVKVGIQIYSFGPISESEMTITMDMFFRLQWYDKRLIDTASFLLSDEKHQVMKSEGQSIFLGDNSYAGQSNQSFNISENSNEYVILGTEHADAIWRPDIYFYDALDIQRPGRGVLSESLILALYADGKLFKSMRLLMKTRCNLSLKLFPMDIQTCNVCMESYLYPEHEVKFSWLSNPEVNLEQTTKYGTANFIVNYNLQSDSSSRHTYIGENYTVLCYYVMLERKLEIFLVTMYLPSISLVALSWVGFWIDKRAVPARASLTITTILAQITLITGTANQFPGIADLKLADLYLIVNFFYVFASLIEFALVSYEPPVKRLARNWLDATRLRMKARGTGTHGGVERNEMGVNHSSATGGQLCLMDIVEAVQEENDVGEDSATLAELLPDMNVKKRAGWSRGRYMSDMKPDKDREEFEQPGAETGCHRHCAASNQFVRHNTNSPQSAMRHKLCATRCRHTCPCRDGEDNSSLLRNAANIQPIQDEIPSLYEKSSHVDHLVPGRQETVINMAAPQSEDKRGEGEINAHKSVGTFTPRGSLGGKFKYKDGSFQESKSISNSYSIPGSLSFTTLKTKKQSKDTLLPQSEIIPESRWRTFRNYFCYGNFSKDNADEISKWLFPLSFLVWNLAYFIIGLTLAGRFPFPKQWKYTT